MKKILLSIVAVCFFLTGCDTSSNKETDGSKDTSAKSIRSYHERRIRHTFYSGWGRTQNH